MIAKLLAGLDRIGKDKYQHFAVGAVLAAAVLLVCAPAGLCAWGALLLSFIVVLVAVLVKECCVDERRDPYDLLATLAGGAVVWVPVLVLNF